MQGLGERVLRTTLTAVRQRRRSQRWNRISATLVGLILLAVLGRGWLTRDEQWAETLSKAAPGTPRSPASVGSRVIRFSTEDVAMKSPVVFRTTDRPPAVVVINDEQLLELCSLVGGGLVTLADHHRIAILTDPSPGAGPAAVGQP